MLLLTLRYTSLRMKELINLRREEVDLDARRISLVGKGRKPRVIPIPHLLADVLREYLDELRPSLPKSAYLFANPRGNRSLRGRYGPRALHNLVVEAGTSAGVAGRHFAHRWRHSYATSLVRRGEDIHVVQRLMAIPTSRRPRGTCICRTRTSSKPSTGLSRKAEFGYYSVVRISGYMPSHASSALR